MLAAADGWLSWCEYCDYRQAQNLGLAATCEWATDTEFKVDQSDNTGEMFHCVCTNICTPLLISERNNRRNVDNWFKTNVWSRHGFSFSLHIIFVVQHRYCRKPTYTRGSWICRRNFMNNHLSLYPYDISCWDYRSPKISRYVDDAQTNPKLLSVCGPIWKSSKWILTL